MAKVYVSSTIADLEAERQAVIDWLVAAQHQVVHSYRPSSDTVRDGCLADVDTSDLYVLILGHRYGFQPPEDNPDGLSITHLEFRRAGQSGKPRIALLRTSIPDISLSDMADPPRLVLVQAFRDEVTRSVRAAEFGDLRGLVQELSTGVLGEVDKLQAERAELANQAAAPVSAGRVVRLAPRPLFLAGREDLLAELEARLARGDGQGPRVVELHGLPGAGKTSVALAYAHSHLTEDGITWQFAAEDSAVLTAGFTELATALGAEEGTGDPVAAVHGALAARAGWLLVFDNAPGPEAVEALVPPVGNGRVLITSRNAVWPGQGLEVPVLDLEAAAGFLMARTGDPDRTAAAGLAEAVGGLPLALEQAAAYAQAAGTSLAGYLAMFERRRAGLLTRGGPARYGRTVATTWALAFGQLQDSDPGAAGLLRLLAFCAPEEIPLRLVLRSRPGLPEKLGPEVAPVLVPLLEDELAAGDAVAALRRYSLVRPAGDGLVSVHRLVQGVTADQMPDELRDAWRQAAAALIEAAIPDEAILPAAWPVCAVLLPHARAVLDLTSRGMWRIAQYLGYSGSYLAARNLFRQIADAHSDDDGYGPEHSRSLAARSYLARWTGDAGDAAGARDQCDALLPILERVLGAEHLETLITRRNLGYYTGEAGDEAGARDQLAALLPILTRVLGHEHQATLTTRRHLARFTGDAGNEAAARDQYAALLPITERVLGPDHPDTLDTRVGLARFTGQAGDAARARDHYAVLLPLRERVSGPEHPDTLDTRHGLAYWTLEAGDAAAARDQFAALLPLRERVLGPDHPDTLTTRVHLAVSSQEAGDKSGARDQFAALLPIAERVLGPGHPRTLMTRHDLAHSTGEAGDAAQARDQLAALLPAYERFQGLEHPLTLLARHDLARFTGEAGDAVRARDQLTALLPAYEQFQGPEHPRILQTRSNLARFTGEAGDAAGARDEFAVLLPIEERVLGAEHPDTLTTRRQLANWTAMAGDAAAARDQLAVLLPIEERVLGAEHPQTLTDRGDLAIWTGAAGDAARARDQLAALLPVRERVSGAEHPDTLDERAMLAYWTGAAGDAAGARDQYAVLLPIQKRVFGPEHPHTLAARGRLAYWTGEAGDPAAARDQYAALLPTLKRVLGDEHPETLIDRSNLADWTGKAGDPAAARDQLAALMSASERVSGAEHPDTLTDYARLARWTGAAGDAAGARDRYAALLPAIERVLGPEHPETQAARETLANRADEADDDVNRGVK